MTKSTFCIYFLLEIMDGSDLKKKRWTVSEGPSSHYSTTSAGWIKKSDPVFRIRSACGKRAWAVTFLPLIASCWNKRKGMNTRSLLGNGTRGQAVSNQVMIPPSCVRLTLFLADCLMASFEPFQSSNHFPVSLLVATVRHALRPDRVRKEKGRGGANQRE